MGKERQLLWGVREGLPRQGQSGSCMVNKTETRKGVLSAGAATQKSKIQHVMGSSKMLEGHDSCSNILVSNICIAHS